MRFEIHRRNLFEVGTLLKARRLLNFYLFQTNIFGKFIFYRQNKEERTLLKLHAESVFGYQDGRFYEVGRLRE